LVKVEKILTYDKPKLTYFFKDEGSSKLKKWTPSGQAIILYNFELTIIGAELDSEN
jgi:hypothetical protein